MKGVLCRSSLEDGGKVQVVEADMLHIRLDNIRAVKRRSWASQNHLEPAGITPSSLSSPRFHFND